MRRHLITGAASGIGQALAVTLLQRGDAVLACDINVAALEALRPHAKSAQQLLLQRLDVRDAAQWQEAIATVRAAWPRLDVLHNIAGVLRPDFIEQITADDIALQLDVNAKGSMLGTQAAWTLMREQPVGTDGRRGQIVNLGSLASLSPVPGSAMYAASKFAIRAYTLSVAPELREAGIAISIVCPDVVATPMITPHLHRDAASLIFSGIRTLQAGDVVQAILQRALDRPAQSPELEIILPRWRGWLCKLGNVAPALAASLYKLMAAQGRKRQAKHPL